MPEILIVFFSVEIFMPWGGVNLIGWDNPRFKTKFSVGEAVKITDGPFADFLGTIHEMDEEKGRVRSNKVKANIPALHFDSFYRAHRMFKEREIPFLQVIERKPDILVGDGPSIVKLHPAP